MPNFGRFETVDELYRTPFGCVWKAHCVDDNGSRRARDYVIKAYDPPPLQAEVSGGAEAKGWKAFQERAQVQKRLSDAGAWHWAAIHELSIADGKPFYVTDYYPRTAQRLIAGRVILDPAALHEIISSVADGLRELREVCNQSHGSLKPTNILIGGVGDLRSAKIVLTDPLFGETPEAKDGEADHYAVGMLLYQLVMHRPFRTIAWPIANSPEWSRLGKSATAWRMLCTLLLNPDARQRPNADLLRRSLAGLAPRALSIGSVAALPRAMIRKGSVRKAVVCMSVFAVFAGGAGTYVGLKQSNCQSRVQVARAKWLDALWNDKPTLARLQSLGEPVIGDADWNVVQVSQERETRLAHLSVSALLRSEAADATVEQIRSRLIADYDRTAEPLRQFQHSYETEGYKQAANYLAAVIAAPPPNETLLAPAIVGRMNLAESLRIHPPPVSAATIGAIQRLVSSEDPDLKAFVQAIVAGIPSTWKLTPDGQWQHDGSDLEGLLARVENVQDWPAAYDEQQLNRDLKINPDHPRVADVRHWLDELSNYQKVSLTAEQLQAANNLKTRLITERAAVQQELSRFPQDNQNAITKLNADCSVLDQEIGQLIHRQFTRKELSEAFASSIAAITRQIDSLHDRNKTTIPGDFAAWYATTTKRGEQLNSPAAREFFDSWMKGRALKDVDNAWREKTTKLADSLTGLEADFAVPGELNLSPWDGPTLRFGYGLIGEILRAARPDTAEIPSDAIAAARQAFNSWCTEVEKLKKDSMALRNPIDESAIAAHDALWKSEEDQRFWKDQATGTGPFAAAMGPLLARVEEVRAIGSLSYVEALDKLRGASSAEISVAAWSRLGKLGRQAFPGELTPADLRQWTSLLRAVDDALLKFPFERPDASQQVNASALAMWKKALEGATGEDLLEAAADAPSQIHFTPDLSAVSALAKYNWLLYLARHADATRAAADRLALNDQIKNLSEWDQYAISTLDSDDSTQAVITRGLYLWSADDVTRKHSWDNEQALISKEIAEAKQQVSAYQIDSAIARLRKLNAPAAKAELSSLLQRQMAASDERLKGQQLYDSKDYVQALAHFINAAQGGDTQALVNMGGMYRDGKGMSHPDVKQSISLLQLAASRGNSNAVTELARAYLADNESSKLAIEVNNILKMFADAASRGDVVAMEAEAQLAMKEHDADGAARWLKRAMPSQESRLPKLMRQLAKLYEEANQGASARQWYVASAAGGDDEAAKWVRSHPEIQNRGGPKLPNEIPTP